MLVYVLQSGVVNSKAELQSSITTCLLTGLIEACLGLVPSMTWFQVCVLVRKLENAEDRHWGGVGTRRVDDPKRQRLMDAERFAMMLFIRRRGCCLVVASYQILPLMHTLMLAAL